MRRVFLLFFILLLMAPATAGAADFRARYALFTRGWPPLEMIQNGEGVGAAVDIFKSVIPGHLQDGVELSQKPRKLLYKTESPVYARLEVKSWMKKQYDYWWTEPVFQLTNVLFSPSGVPLEYYGPRSLEGKTIGCIRNYNYPEIEHLFATGKAKRHDVNQDTLLLRLVANGRVDAVIMDSIVARWTIKNSDEFDVSSFHVARNPVATNDVRFVFNRVPGWDAHLDEINERIKLLHETGEIRRIFNRYE